MPIKFACPKCKTVLQVSSSKAGQQGKCKCGQQFKIPTPKAKPAVAGQPAGRPAGPAPMQPAPAPAPAPPSSAMFDELAESDFAREDPYKAVYDKKQTNNTNDTLNKYEIGEELTETQKKKEAGKEQVWQTIGIYCTIGLVQIGFLAILWTFYEADNKTRISEARKVAAEFGENADDAEAEIRLEIGFVRVFFIVLMAITSVYFICAGTFFYLPFTSAIIAILLFIFQQIIYIVFVNPFSLISIRDWIIRAALFGGFVQGINNAAYYNYIKKQKD